VPNHIRTADASREMLIRTMAAEERINAAEHAEFISQLEPSVNAALKNISLENESRCDSAYKSFIKRAWKDDSRFPLVEHKLGKISKDWEEYIWDDNSSGIRAELYAQVTDLLQRNEIRYTTKRVKKIVIDILMDMEERLCDRLFGAHMRALSIPEDFIRNFCAPSSQGPTQRILYRPQEDTHTQEAEPTQSAIIYPWPK